MSENVTHTTTVRVDWQTYRALTEAASTVKTAPFPRGMPLSTFLRVLVDAECEILNLARPHERENTKP